MSEFRHDYAKKLHHPLSHPPSSYALTRQTQSKLSEGDGEKEVVNKRRFFSLLRFNLLLFIIIG